VLQVKEIEAIFGVNGLRRGGKPGEAGPIEGVKLPWAGSPFRGREWGSLFPLC
jgi:hypothetical protein